LLVELLLLHAAKATPMQMTRNLPIELRCITVPSTDMDRSLGLLRGLECHIRTGVATALGDYPRKSMLCQNENDDGSVDRSSEFLMGWNTCADVQRDVAARAFTVVSERRRPGSRS
jgi:hypothetical protein